MDLSTLRAAYVHDSYLCNLHKPYDIHILRREILWCLYSQVLPPPSTNGARQPFSNSFPVSAFCEPGLLSLTNSAGGNLSWHTRILLKPDCSLAQQTPCLCLYAPEWECYQLVAPYLTKAIASRFFPLYWTCCRTESWPQWWRLSSMKSIVKLRGWANK